MFLAIDPGQKTGIAIYSPSGALVYAEVHLKDFQRMAAHFAAIVPITSVVCELPQVYRPGMSKGDPNDLIGLAVQCGWAEALTAFYSRDARCHLVRPHDWKGDLTKIQTERRARMKLSPTENMIADNGGHDHNKWDAVALGLWLLKKRGLRG